MIALSHAGPRADETRTAPSSSARPTSRLTWAASWATAPPCASWPPTPAPGHAEVYFVGSGGSWASMYSGKYLCDRFAPVASDVALSYDLIWRAPRRLGPDSLVVLASYSGATEDTLAALRFARERGARTVALVREGDSPIGARPTKRSPTARPGSTACRLMAVTCFAWNGAGWTATGKRRADRALPDARPGRRGVPHARAGRELAASWATPTSSTASARGRCTASPTSSG